LPVHKIKSVKVVVICNSSLHLYKANVVPLIKIYLKTYSYYFFASAKLN